MCLKVVSVLFVLAAFVLALQLISVYFGITKKMSPMKASDYVSSIAGVLLAYILFALILAIVTPSVYNKVLLIGFSGMPFIIGWIVRYNSLNFYSLLQILCVIMSGVYVLTL